MNVFYRKDMNQSYIVLSEKEEQEIDYQILMLERNEIQGLLPFHIKQIDRQLQYVYETSGKQSIRKWLEENKLSHIQVRKLIKALVNIMGELDCYLLMNQCLLLEEEYIYIDADNWNVYFCYYPPNNQNREEGIRSLLQFILKKIDHKDPEAVFFAYNLFQESLSENVSLKKLQMIVEQDESGEWNTCKRTTNKGEWKDKKKEDYEEQYENELSEEDAELQAIASKEKETVQNTMSNSSFSENSNWSVPEQLKIPNNQGAEEEQRIANAKKLAEKNGHSKLLSNIKEGILAEKIWMAVPFLTLFAVIIIFSGKVVPIQKIWGKYPWICMGILLFVLGFNFIIVKRWYFDEEETENK